GADGGAGAGLGPGALTGGAVVAALHLEDALGAARRLEEGQGEVPAQVVPAHGGVSPARVAAGTAAEEVLEDRPEAGHDVVEVAVGAHVALDRVVTVAIVDLAALGVGQDLVGLRRLLE